MRFLRETLAVLVGLAVFAMVAELTVRMVDPMPRSQVIRPGTGGSNGMPGFRVVGDTPLWRAQDSERRRDPGCEPGSRNVLLLGSSIFWGTSYNAQDVVSAKLQERLDPTRASLCVRNYAQPAYVGANKLAELEEALPELQPVVVVWEVWTNEPDGYTVIDGAAYNLARGAVDAEGYPVSIPGLPASVHHFLFRTSEFWEYAHLAMSTYDATLYEAVWRAHLSGRMARAKQAIDAVGARWVLVLMPPLDRPFAEFSKEIRFRNRGYSWVIQWADENGVPWIDVADALRDRDYKGLRHDPCCHLNPAGHEALAELLAPRIQALVGESPPAP